MCGGSQKVVSAPPGLTFVVVSSDAKKAMTERKTPIASFYANLTTFAHYYEEKWFPYTMPINDIYGLRAAIDNIADDPGILTRHAKIAAASRKAITGAGLKLYLHSGYSSTVTVFEVPECTTAAAILDGVKKTTTSCLQVLSMFSQARSSASATWETMQLSTMYATFSTLWTEPYGNLVFRLPDLWKKSSVKT